MTIKKPKLPTLVASQLPEFVREDYQTFVTFVKAYYEYLENNILVDLYKVSDVDSTLDSFLQYFKSEVALNFPATLIDDRFLLPKLKELYISKGTIASYNLLFRILYNKEITIKQPSSQMLRVSDGKWVQNISIFVDLKVGSFDSVIGKTANIVSSDRNNRKNIVVVVDNYKTTETAGIYEVVLINNFLGTFEQGDLFNYGSNVSGVITNIVKQQGYYSNSDGFLNSDMYIQDSKYYQAFSYVIQIDELFESYKSAVKNLIHPAGTELFGEYHINTILELSEDTDINFAEFLLGLTTDAGQLTNENGDILIFVL